ncbi:MAG: hypothetical protein J7551_07350 [Chloroflexi bacterium]|nr:hypothetical protein [Chloroflexota bacterium]
MAYYLVLLSPSAYESFAGSLTFPAGRASALAALQRGDCLIAYLPALARWIGVLEVQAVHGRQVRVQPTVWLSLAQGVPLAHNRLWNALSFTRSRDPSMATAIPTLRTTLTPLSNADGALLASFLRAHAESGQETPYDQAAYQALLARRLTRNDGSNLIVAMPDLHDMHIEDLFYSNIEGRETVRVQALLAEAGAKMGYAIWIPHEDRPVVFREWRAKRRPMLDSLDGLNLDLLTRETLERFDMLWLQDSQIARAFEIEHSYSIYLGLLRIADLFSLQPQAATRVHLVAPDSRRERIFQEIARPCFSLMQPAPLRELVTYLSYEAVRDFAAQPLQPFGADRLDAFAEAVD